MAAITGTEKARTTARVGKMRIGAFRVGYVPRRVNDVNTAFPLATPRAQPDNVPTVRGEED